jgi:glycosyltransferase involved in cell wall biosynthesis
MARPRIAWFTPLQPVESGISLYSEEILPILSRVCDVKVFVEGYRPNVLRETDLLRVHDASSFNADDFDSVVYQVGNSPAHIYMLKHLLTTPGIVVLHDTMVNHLFIQRAAREGTLLEYRTEMERRYGKDGGVAADRVLKGQAPDDLFRFPLSEQVVDASLVTVVHSEFAREQVCERSPQANVVRIPHGLRLPERLSREDARRALGLPVDQFIIASISHINPHKRLDVVLRALKELRKSIPARLILAGSVSPNFPLHRMINHLGLDQVVETPGYVSDPEARLIAAAADVIVNLRYPTAGETSGSLLHSMAACRPVLVSQTGSFTEIPPGAAIPIPVDALEQETLVAFLKRLAGDPAFVSEVGNRARAFIEEEHSLCRWANGYVDVISSVSGVDIPYPMIEEPSGAAIPRESGSAVVPDMLTISLARDIAELGLGGDESVLRDVATARVELGLGVGKITLESGEPELTTGDEHVEQAVWPDK